MAYNRKCIMGYYKIKPEIIDHKADYIDKNWR